jgi:hypothetical protein
MFMRIIVEDVKSFKCLLPRIRIEKHFNECSESRHLNANSNARLFGVMSAAGADVFASAFHFQRAAADMIIFLSATHASKKNIYNATHLYLCIAIASVALVTNGLSDAERFVYDVSRIIKGEKRRGSHRKFRKKERRGLSFDRPKNGDGVVRKLLFIYYVCVL